MLICYWWLKKKPGEEFVIQCLDIQMLIANIWKITIKKINYSFLTHLDEKKLHGCEISQKLQAEESKCIGSTSFTEHLITYNNGIGTVVYTLELDIKYPEQLGMIDRELLFLSKKWNLFLIWKLMEKLNLIKKIDTK